MRAARSAALLALAMITLACSDRGAQESAIETGADAATASVEVAHDGSRSGRVLADGQAFLRVDGERIDLHAQAADRLTILRALADELGFAVEVHPEGFAWPPLSVAIDAEPIAAVLPVLFGEVPYESEYVKREDGGEDAGGLRLVAVRAGSPPTGADAERGVDPREAKPGDWIEDRSVSDVVGQAIQALRTEAPPKDPLALARSASPAERVRAALWLPPRGEGLVALTGLLLSDPDPAVRAAATAGLEESRSEEALAALVKALDDPSPDVVVEVIDSIAFAGGPAQIEALRPFLDHPDERVRQAAAAAKDFLDVGSGPVTTIR